MLYVLCRKHLWSQGSQLVSNMYFAKAMDYYRRTYNSGHAAVLFVVASDDYEWCYRAFGDKPDDVVMVQSAPQALRPYYAGETFNRQFDMAVLARCNHSIIRFVVLEYFRICCVYVLNMHVRL